MSIPRDEAMSESVLFVPKPSGIFDPVVSSERSSNGRRDNSNNNNNPVHPAAEEEDKLIPTTIDPPDQLLQSTKPQGTQMALQVYSTTETQTPNREASGSEENAADEQVKGTTTTARERELESLLKASQSAFQTDFDRRTQEMEDKYRGEIQQKDVTISQLKVAVARQQETITQHQATIDKNEENLLERSRELRRQALENESDMKSELARVRLQKEKERFNREKIEAALKNSESATNLVESRAQEAEVRWLDSSRRSLLRHEEESRLEFEIQHQHGLGLLMDSATLSLSKCRDLERAKFKEVRKVVKQVKKLGEDRGSSAVSRGQAEAHDTSSSDDEGADVSIGGKNTEAKLANKEFRRQNLIEVEDTFIKLHIEKEAERERKELMELSYKENLISMKNAVEALHLEMEKSEAKWHTRWEDSQNRLRASEHQVETLKQFYSSSSRSGRAEAVVLDALVAEHEEERQEMKRTMRELEESLEYHRTVNKTTEAAEWRTKAEKLAKELNETAQSRGSFKAQVAALQAETKSSEGLLQSLKTRLVQEEQKYKDHALAHQQREAELKARVSSLESDAATTSNSTSHLRERIEVQEEELDELREKCSLLQRRNETLRDKWIEFDAVPPKLSADGASVLEESHHRGGEGTQRSPDTRRDEAKTKDDQGEKPTSAEPKPAFQRLGSTSQEPQSSEENIATAAAVREFQTKLDSMEQQVLLLKKERDTLKRQLDSAAAEISASEERRGNTLNRYLNLLSANDAAPRREQNMQARSFELEQREIALNKRQEELVRKNLEIEKKEAQITRTIAMYQARGVNVLQSGGGSVKEDPLLLSGSRKLGSMRTPRSQVLLSSAGTGGEDFESRSVGDRSDSMSISIQQQRGAQQQGASKQILSPIMSRPLVQPGSSSSARDAHPQRAPVPTQHLPPVVSAADRASTARQQQVVLSPLQRSNSGTGF